MAGRLGVAVALEAGGWHPAAWRVAEGGPFGGGWNGAAVEAERGGLDFLTVEGGFSLGGERGRPDAVLLVAGMLAVTSRIGVFPTVTARFGDPAGTVAALATLQGMAPGRVGWRVQAGRREEAPAFGGGHVPVIPPEELERTGALSILLEEAASYVERAAPELPVAALAHAPAPYRFAARVADLVFVTPHDRDDAVSIVAQVREAERRTERARPPLRIYADLVVFLDHRQKALLDELAGAEYVSDARIFTGSPAELADLMLDWRDAGLDGYRLRPGLIPADLTAITRELMPLLRADR